MKPRLYLILILIIAQTLPLLWVNSVKANSKKNVYSCINHQGKPMTVVDTMRGRIQLIVWESDYFRASGWTPEKRCQEVTNRFQEFSDQGILKYVTTGIMNKYPVICLGEKVQKPQAGDTYQCQSDGLLITLQMNDKPTEVMRQLFEDAVKTGAMPVSRGKAVLDLEKYFATAPLIDVASGIWEKTPENTSNPSSKETKIECPSVLCD